MSDEADRAAEAYGGEIATPVIRSMYPSRSRGQAATEFADAFLAGIAWARANPGPEVLGLVEALEIIEKHNSEVFYPYGKCEALSAWQAARGGS